MPPNKTAGDEAGDDSGAELNETEEEENLL